MMQLFKFTSTFSGANHEQSPCQSRLDNPISLGCAGPAPACGNHIHGSRCPEAIRLRQASITSEIMEIVGGAAALDDGDTASVYLDMGDDMFGSQLEGSGANPSS